MKEKLLRWLIYNGITGSQSAKFRWTLHKNAVYTIERLYRFRWQDLRVSLSGMHWGAKGQLARFPDSGRAFAGITTANEKAEDDRLFRQIKSRTVLDINDPEEFERKMNVVPPILEVVPPILDREAHK